MRELQQADDASEKEMTTIEQTPPRASWHLRPADDVAAELGVDPDRGLDAGEVEGRLRRYGPNELPKDPPLSKW
jgi:Ca2+-transporting ATPase